MAETMQDNLAGQLTILQSALQELAISFSDILMPTIRSIVSKIQELVDKFNGLDERTKTIIAKVAVLGNAAKELQAELILLEQKIAEYETAQTTAENASETETETTAEETASEQPAE